MPHYWTSKPVPTVTLPTDASGGTACTCADFTNAGTCTHVAEALAQWEILDSRRGDHMRRLVALRAEILAAVDQMSDEALEIFYSELVLLDRGLTARPSGNN